MWLPSAGLSRWIPQNLTLISISKSLAECQDDELLSWTCSRQGIPIRGKLLCRRKISFSTPSLVPCSQLGEHIAVAENAIRRRELGRLGVPGRGKKGIRSMITRRLGWGLFPGNRPRPPLCEMPQGLLHFRFREEQNLCRKSEIWMGTRGVGSWFTIRWKVNRQGGFFLKNNFLKLKTVEKSFFWRI